MDATLLTLALLAAPLNDVLEGMADDEYAVREQANAKLLATLNDSPGVAWLARLHTQHGDPEVRRRVRHVLEKHDVRIAETLVPTGYRKMPWVDSLPPDYPDRGVLIQAYLRRAYDGGDNYDPPEWSRYRRATSLFARDLYLQGRTREEIVELLDLMALNDLRCMLAQTGSARAAGENQAMRELGWRR